MGLSILIKGALLNLGLTFLDNGVTQLVWIMIVLTLYQFATVCCMPWRHMLANIIDISTYMLLVLSSGCLLCFAKDFLLESEVQTLDQDVAIFAIVFSTALLPLCAIVFARIIHQGVSPVSAAARQQNIGMIREAMNALCHTRVQDGSCPYTTFVEAYQNGTIGSCYRLPTASTSSS